MAVEKREEILPYYSSLINVCLSELSILISKPSLSVFWLAFESLQDGIGLSGVIVERRVFKCLSFVHDMRG